MVKRYIFKMTYSDGYEVLQDVLAKDIVTARKALVRRYAGEYVDVKLLDATEEVRIENL